MNLSITKELTLSRLESKSKVHGGVPDLQREIEKAIEIYQFK